MPHATLDDWIRDEAIPFTVAAPASTNAAIDRLMAALGGAVDLLGFGETLHGGEEILQLRNRLFQRLVEAHGFSAIALESSFARGHVANEFVAGRGPDTYAAVQDTGVSHGFGQLEANRELLEWMRHYNAEPARRVKLSFYGFDLPVLAAGIASPSQVLHFVLDYVDALDSAAGQAQRQRVDALLGSDAAWENPAGMADPSQSIGLSPAASELRLATEDLITLLRINRPAWVAQSDAERYGEALQHALAARELLNFHAGLAKKTDNFYGRLMGLRDAWMADNLAYMVARERGRGRVLAFAHNNHLMRGASVLPWATWWPAGAHLHEQFGPRYAVIGSAVGVSEANGIGQAEPGTLEARLTAAPGPARFIPTHSGQGLPAAEIAALPTRSGSPRNNSYLPLSPRSLTDFDWLAVVEAVTYARGGPPLPQADAVTE